MSEAGKQFKLNLRLPKVLEDHVRSFAAKYELSLNDAVKFTLIQHHLHSQFGPTHGPTDGAKVEQKEKVQSGPVDGPTVGAKKATPSRAPSIMSNYVNIYTYNNNKIIFIDSKLQQSWMDWKKYRGIKVAQEKFQQRYIDKVLAHESPDQLAERFINSIANGWKGFVFPNETFGEQTTTEYGDEDL
jgi:hypothetical protein